MLRLTTDMLTTAPKTFPKAPTLVGPALLAFLLWLLVQHGVAQSLATSLPLKLKLECKVQQGSFSSDFSSDFDVNRQRCAEGRFTVEFAGGKLSRVSVMIGDTEYSLPSKG